MENIPEILLTLGLLILLQAVLGFDNLLYISLESKRAPEADRSRIRKWGIGIAVGLRIVLLFALVKMIASFQNTWFAFPESWGAVAAGSFNLHSLVVLLGGGFIIYTAMKEIFHMLAVDDLGEEDVKRKASTSKSVIAKIVLMNLVFSFDSILSAIALTSVDGNISTTGLCIMMLAVLVGGALMILLADRVSEFLQRNRMYEVLGLFILFVVGIMLLSEGGHLAGLSFFGHEIHAMSKATFYFVIAVLVLTEIVQSRYKKKLLRQKSTA
ncbi:MAG: tellurium resistance protein TerC [Verrucomicrobia subdivision 3 bacterium]|nr:tellurium resistance protein TerC [Limisphaerales bacterium]